MRRCVAVFLAAILALVLCPVGVHAQLAEPWSAAYSGNDSTGFHVHALWKFDSGHETADSSGRKHTLTLHGSNAVDSGKFGGGLECDAGWPASDMRHAAVAAHHSDLSPAGPFSLEMWVQAKPELKTHKGNVYLVDKKYVAHSDYQWILDAPAADGGRMMKVTLGFGTDSETWFANQPVQLEAGAWHHLAMTYDAAGTVRFLMDGVPIGVSTKPGRGAVIGGTQALSIGDRLGSYYAGFPGVIDEVRLTTGVREFRAVSVVDVSRRHVFLRGEPSPELTWRVRNHTRAPMESVRVTVAIPGTPAKSIDIGRIESGKHHDLPVPFDTLLRPDLYEVSVRVDASADGKPIRTEESVPVTLVARPTPLRMPVVMWGVGGVEGVTSELPRLRRIGFTHCLGLGCDYDAVWKAKAPAAPDSPTRLEAADRMLDAALANDLGIVISLSPGHWLESKPELLRVDRDGKAYKRVNIANASPELTPFFENVGASVAKQWGDHPAVHAALIDSEVRDGTSPSYRPEEREAFRKHSEFEIPEAVDQPWGISWTKLKDFPKDRIVPDNHPVLSYYRWFWSVGDGWNGWHSDVHRGFHQADGNREGKPPLWTFFDPAVRVPSLFGSGGDVDFISHWTYTYPDPIRIGLCTDELLAMAAGATRKPSQQVMKMTQVIWYRSQTAPTAKTPEAGQRSPWEDFDPDAAYITIAPMHLREALWLKLSRPVQGIMYHGWQSLVPGEKSAYRYTHSETQHELARLVKDVVEPLGPALRQVPAVASDVAMLESFSSQMLARRGTYGWGTSWAADCWHVLQYAHLPPDIIYDETILKRGLDQYRVLVLPDCDVLTKSVAEKIQEFQKRGGIVVGDDRLAPGITPDLRLSAFTRNNKADDDKAALVRLAAELRRQLDAKYSPTLDSAEPDVIVHRRRAGEGEYVFAINDRREFGSYVGQHKLVMEHGLPVATSLSARRPESHVYDLRTARKVVTETAGGAIKWPVTLAPSDGAVYLLTPRAINQVLVDTPETSTAGAPLSLSVRIVDVGNQPIDAVIPLQVDILDPDGRPAEFSGPHAAVGGLLTLPLQIAPNDVHGVWTIRVQDRASGLIAQKFVRVGRKP
jgi:hypothetical protein